MKIKINGKEIVEKTKSEWEGVLGEILAFLFHPKMVLHYIFFAVVWTLFWKLVDQLQYIFYL